MLPKYKSDTFCPGQNASIYYWIYVNNHNSCL